MKKLKLKLLPALLPCGSAYAQQRDAHVAIAGLRIARRIQNELKQQGLSVAWLARQLGL